MIIIGFGSCYMNSMPLSECALLPHSWRRLGQPLWTLLMIKHVLWWYADWWLCANVGCCEVIPPSDILIVDGIFVLKLLKPLKILHSWDRPNTWELEMIICSESPMQPAWRCGRYLIFHTEVLLIFCIMRNWKLFVYLSWILFFLWKNVFCIPLHRINVIYQWKLDNIIFVAYTYGNTVWALRSHFSRSYVMLKILSTCIFIEVLISESHGGCVGILFCYIQFNYIFHENYASLKFCDGGIFASMFIKELQSGVYRHEYPYHVAIFHSTAVTLSMKIMCWSICY